MSTESSYLTEFEVYVAKPELLVNRLGEVKLKNTGYKLSQSKMPNGDYAVNLNHRKVLVKKMVAETFIPNDDPKKIYVVHKNNDKSNNKFDNLRWVAKEDLHKYNLGEDRRTLCLKVNSLPEGVTKIETINKKQMEDFYYLNKVFYKKYKNSFRSYKGSKLANGLNRWTFKDKDGNNVTFTSASFLFEYPQFKKDFNLSEEFVPPEEAIKIDSIGGVPYDHIYYYNKILYIKYNRGLIRYHIPTPTYYLTLGDKKVPLSKERFFKEYPQFK